MALNEDGKEVFIMGDSFSCYPSKCKMSYNAYKGEGPDRKIVFDFDIEAGQDEQIIDVVDTYLVLYTDFYQLVIRYTSPKFTTLYIFRWCKWHQVIKKQQIILYEKSKYIDEFQDSFLNENRISKCLSMYY